MDLCFLRAVFLWDIVILAFLSLSIVCPLLFCFPNDNILLLWGEKDMVSKGKGFIIAELFTGKADLFSRCI